MSDPKVAPWMLVALVDYENGAGKNFLLEKIARAYTPEAARLDKALEDLTKGWPHSKATIPLTSTRVCVSGCQRCQLDALRREL